MGNKAAWDEEYKKPKLITKSEKPPRDFLKFLQWIKKNKHLELRSGLRVLDLGCGIGRNAYYLARVYGMEVFAWDFSPEAVRIAREHFSHELVHYEERDISKAFPLKDESIDLIIDSTSSNSLKEKERSFFVNEVARVLKKSGYLYLRTLAKEGDKNAKNLIAQFPSGEKDGYIHPVFGVHERVFSGPDIRALYEPKLRVVRMTRKTAYQKFGKQSYKRNYWNVYLTKE